MPANDLSAKTKPDTDSSYSSIVESTLGKPFADIDWQVPWLSHIAQLNYLSTTIEHLSNTSRQVDSMGTPKAVGSTPDVVVRY